MNDDRRYDEEEVRRIFARASEADAPPSSAASGARGLTLAEIQDIGDEVGLAREAVARAAATLDATGGRPRFFGVPVGVSHTVPLPRTLTEEEWERLVTDLRQTFRAPGRLESRGGLRRWSNGNLHVFVEPGPSGPRLRMQTTKGTAVSLMRAGTMLLGMALVVLVILALTGGLASGGLRAPLMLLLMGVGAFGAAGLSLPRWSGTRREQMKAIGQRLLAGLDALPPGEGADLSPGPRRVEAPDAGDVEG